MAKAKSKKRAKPKDAGRRLKKKTSILSSERIDYVDWKDASLLRRFLSERSKIRARRVTGNTTQQQKMVADAIKIAREMALVPYANRVTTQRGGRGERDRLAPYDMPLPRPLGPPPSSASSAGSTLSDTSNEFAEEAFSDGEPAATSKADLGSDTTAEGGDDAGAELSGAELSEITDGEEKSGS